MAHIEISENMVQALEVIAKDMGVSKSRALIKSVALLKVINSRSEEAGDYCLTIETASGKKYRVDLL